MAYKLVIVNELWKPVPGYEGIYEVSTFGRIRSFFSAKCLKPDANSKGYLRVWLVKDGLKKRYFIHRLVALTFLPKPFNYNIINHRDENPQNNYVWNLEWCNHKYNSNYGYVKAKHIRTKKESGKIKKVGKYSDTKLIEVYESTTEAALSNGVTYNAINNAIVNKRTSCGYKWRYIV